MKTCYMCDSPVTSREHVPPKCIFPEKKDLPRNFDFRKNLISVPSCDKHNSHKSKDDEYLMFVLSTGFYGNSHKDRHFQSKILRAFKRKPYVFSSFMKDLTPVYLKDKDGNVSESATYKVDKIRFNSIFHQMACGIYYYHYKKKWLGNSESFNNVLMEFSAENSPEINNNIHNVAKQTSDAFSHITSVGENEEIFKYRIISGEKDQHAIHMVFYQGIEVTVMLSNV